MSSATCFNLDQSKILSSGKELRQHRMKSYENLTLAVKEGDI